MRWRQQWLDTWHRRCPALNHDRCRCATRHRTDDTRQRCRPSATFPTCYLHALYTHKHTYTTISNMTDKWIALPVFKCHPIPTYTTRQIQECIIKMHTTSSQMAYNGLLNFGYIFCFGNRCGQLHSLRIHLVTAESNSAVLGKPSNLATVVQTFGSHWR